jgi:hypothetical protein
MLINVPTFKCVVANEFLTGGKQSGFTEGYLVAVRCLKSRPLFFTVHLQNGALYSNVPINHIYAESSTKGQLELHEAQPWSCLEPPVNAVLLAHMKDYDVRVLSRNLRGRYLFTIDYHGEGLAQDPEQHKMHHVIETEEHCLVAMPNNYCIFGDQYFTKQMDLGLSRQTEYLRTY